MAVAPMMYSEKFSPAGQVSDSQISRSQEMAQSFNQDQQAAMFQQHLQKGLKGMQEVMTQLPPEVASQVGDPTPMSGSDELRVQWYQGVNTAINRLNMANAAAAGDQAGVDRMSLYGKNVPQSQFDAVAQREQFRKFSQDAKTTKTSSSVAMPLDALRDSIVSQESGDNWFAEGPVYTKSDGSKASMNAGEIALGRYQILPKAWFGKIGLDHTSEEDRKKFLGSQALQNEAFNIVIQDGMTKYNGNIDKVLADYYGGPRAAALVGTPAGDRPQSAGMPSINDYVKSVKAKIEAAGPSGSGQVVTEEKNKGAEDFALEVLKSKPDLIGTPQFEALLKSLGSGADAFKAKALALRERDLALNEKAEGRRERSLGLKEQEGLDKKIQWYVKQVKDMPAVASDLNELDEAIDIDGTQSIAGVGWGAKPFRDWMLATNPESAPVRKLLAGLFTRLGHEISGANFTEREMKNLEAMLGISFFDTEDSFRFAMRRLRKEAYQTLKNASAGMGDKGKQIAQDRGVFTDEQVRDLGSKPDTTSSKPITREKKMSAEEADAILKEFD